MYEANPKSANDVAEVDVYELAVVNGRAQIDGTLIIDGQDNYGGDDGFTDGGEAYAIGGSITATNVLNLGQWWCHHR